MFIKNFEEVSGLFDTNIISDVGINWIHCPVKVSLQNACVCFQPVFTAAVLLCNK